MGYEKLDKKSKELVRKILDAAEDERGIVQQIRRISGSSDVSGVKSMALSEGQTVIPEALQRELDEKRAELAGYMKDAVEIELGEVPMVKNNYKRYVGEELPE